MSNHSPAAGSALPEIYQVLPDMNLRSGFLAMYAGAHTPATIFKKDGGLFCGKAECEWIWPEGWNKLRDLGLIEYRTEDVRCFDWSIMQEVHFNTTERGDKLRDEFWDYRP